MALFCHQRKTSICADGTRINCLSIICLSHSSHKHYPNVTLKGCGIGRQSLMSSGKCFKWLSNTTTTQMDIHLGRNAQPGEVPFIVYIQIGNYGGRGTGIILNERWILTAAHAIDFPINDLLVYPGVLDTNNMRTDNSYRPMQTFIHPMFKQTTKTHNPAFDIGLIKLGSDLPITGHRHHQLGAYRTLNGICLPRKLEINSVNELALYAGYGYIDETTKTLVNRLQLSYTMIIRAKNNTSDEQNRLIWSYRYPPEIGSRSCAGDSGGPLYQYSGSTDGRAVLIGINSVSRSNHPCDVTDQIAYTLYPRVSMHIDWIIQLSIICPVYWY
ncbi:venom peptide isomerase heavy chain-like [Oppia nitens]|uniref:venom peptide isomerase heavy chain-like n=1 Tax=Oppia nitens TaxID=1686743 RepID=UPI0023DB8ED5|nr:venom peptide isomerase heavy chain-like [Oppia nitens]